MELCPGGHDEVCCPVRNCPVCLDIEKKRQELQDEIDTPDVINERDGLAEELDKQLEKED